MFSINGIIWNCRGAGGPNFHSLMRDYIRIHHLNYVAIFEPRISGPRVDDVCRRIGLQGTVRVDAIGFSGGILCLWNPARINITVLDTNTYCIHLGVDLNTLKAWVLSIVYASPQLHLRPILWESLENFNATNILPWCLVGDFNTTLQEHEKEGGAAFNHCSSQQFADCIEACNLLDLVFKGPPFTWVRDSLRQRIDRALCNIAWLTLFPNSQVIHLPIPSSNHCAIFGCRTSRTRIQGVIEIISNFIARGSTIRGSKTK